MLNLQKLLEGFRILSGVEHLDLIPKKICCDSRLLAPGDVFVSLKGLRFDAHQNLAEILLRKPLALVLESEFVDDAVKVLLKNYTGTVALTESTHSALAILASRAFDDPSSSLFTVGVTGTNGKTSITYLTECILSHVGISTGVIGTINHHLGAKIWPTEMTTPNALELIKRVQEMKLAKAKALAIEVSSHSLDQHRVSGLNFDVAQFTNLTRDHLDYHKTMDHYFKSKSRFFTDILNNSSKKEVWSVINVDDTYGKAIVPCSRSRILTYGNHNADLRFRIQFMDPMQTIFDLDTPAGTTLIQVPLTGLHNIYNCCAAIGAALAKGLSLESIREALASFKGIPGRLQLVQNNKDRAVYIDYAHTPDALENVLKTLDQLRQGLVGEHRIITIFGCGGDRDKGKRPEMAKIAEALSDVVIVTSDNPRTEDPEAILSDICKGFSISSKKWTQQSNRKLAIEEAIQSSKTGDLILIAGKGHEDYQIIGHTKFPFSDFEIAKTCLGSLA